MILHYTNFGDAVGDRDCRRYLIERKQASGANDVVAVRSVCVIREAQLMIAEGKLDPIDIKFQWNGLMIKHDRFGRFITRPEGYSDPSALRGIMFQYKVRHRMLEELPPDKKQELGELRVEWFNENLYNVIVVEQPTVAAGTDEADAENSKPVKPTELIVAPDAAGAFHVDPAGRPKVVCKGWAAHPDSGAPILVTSGGLLTVDELCDFAFASDGGKLVPCRFSVAHALSEMGLDGKAYDKVSFD